MKKHLVLALAIGATLALAGSALATTTWSQPAAMVSQATTTTGTEAAPTLATQGFDLTGVGGFSVHVESIAAADGGAQVFSAGTLLGYSYNPISAKWDRASELDLVVAAGGTTAAYSGFTVSSARGRVAWMPSGLGVPVQIYIVGTRAR